VLLMPLSRFPSLIKDRLRVAFHKVKITQASILLRDSLKCDSHLTLAERKILYELSANKNTIAEIGSYLGASACCFAAALQQTEKTVYCIDTWSNDSMTEGNWDTWRSFRNNTRKYSSIIVPLRGWSTDMAKHLARYTKRIDLLFIDGAHDYDSVKADWESYKAFLDIGSVIVFHDIGWAEGVQTVVNEDVVHLTKSSEKLPNMWWGTISKKP
jgi:predicted O-methyltransferase YrrM